MQKLSVVSYNAFGAPFYGSKMRHQFLRTKISLRFRKIGQILNQSDADILCFQEVLTFRHLSRLKIELANFPYCAYEHFLLSPRGGVTIFSKYPFSSVRYIDFGTKGKYWNKSITGRITRRGLLIARLRDLPLTIINTHLTQNSDHDWSENNRYMPIIRAQVDQLRQTIDEVGTNVIVTTDMNLPKTTSLFAELLKEAKLFDAFKNESSPTYIAEYLFGTSKPQRIDYILYKGKGLQEKSRKHILTQKERLANGLEAHLSDHIGLQADFLIKDKV